MPMARKLRSQEEIDALSCYVIIATSEKGDFRTIPSMSDTAKGMIDNALFFQENAMHTEMIFPVARRTHDQIRELISLLPAANTFDERIREVRRMIEDIKKSYAVLSIEQDVPAFNRGRFASPPQEPRKRF